MHVLHQNILSVEQVAICEVLTGQLAVEKSTVGLEVQFVEGIDDTVATQKSVQLLVLFMGFRESDYTENGSAVLFFHLGNFWEASFQEFEYRFD